MKLAPGTSVLIVLMGSVGDVARGLVVVEQLRRQVPELKISWLVEPKSADLVRLHRGIDNVILFERGNGLRAVFALQRKLLERRYDIVLDLQRHFKSGFFSWLAGAPRRIGFNRSDAKEFNHLFSSEQIRSRGAEIPKLDHYLTFIEHLGLEIQQPLEFGLGERALEIPLVGGLPADLSRSVGVLLGSAWSSKDWVAEGYDGLIKLLLDDGSRSVVLLGDKSVVALADSLVAAHRSEHLMSVAGKTTLMELVGILARLSVVTGPDSGPGHIAAALGVPYVALFGATSPRRTAPYGSEDLAISCGVGCSPCYLRECPGLNRICMRLISPRAVYDRVIAAALR